MNKHICKYCGKEFETGAKLGGHVVVCKCNPNYSIVQDKIKNSRKSNIKYIDDDVECPICGNFFHIHVSQKDFDQSRYKKTCSLKCAHKLSVKNTDIENKNQKIKRANCGFRIIEGEMYVIKKPRKRICENCGKEYEYYSSNQINLLGLNIQYNSKKYCCEECKNVKKHEKLSKLAKKCGFGGYHPNSIKKHHHGDYAGIHCDSSWELAFLAYCIEHNINIKRCQETRYYYIDNIKRKYFPDFVVDGQIIEIKGYPDDVSKIKSEQNPDIKVLYKKDMKLYLDYVENKYGKEFWNVLYQK